MDIVPPESTTPDENQPTEKSKKIVRFRRSRPGSGGGEKPKQSAKRKLGPLALKVKLENYRAIFNASPKGGAAERQAVAKIALLLKDMSDEDPNKHEYVRIALDYHQGDDMTGAALCANLLSLVEHVEHAEEKMKTYHVLMRSKYCDDAVKEAIGVKMLALLETI